MDRIHRHKRRLSPCPDAQGCEKLPAIQSEQEDLPVHLSTIRIGISTLGSLQWRPCLKCVSRSSQFISTG